MRALGARAQQHPPVAERQPFPQRVLGRGRERERALGGERDHVDLGLRHAEPLDEVGPRAGGVDDDPARAPRGGGHEQPHPERPQPEVGLRNDQVVEVVDRRHTRHPAPQRRRARERMDQVAARARRHARDVLLLAAHPLHA